MGGEDPRLLHSRLAAQFPPAEPQFVLDLCGGMGSMHPALASTEANIAGHHLIELDPTARRVAEHRIKHSHGPAAAPTQLGARVGHDVHVLANHTDWLPPISLVLAACPTTRLDTAEEHGAHRANGPRAALEPVLQILAAARRTNAWVQFAIETADFSDAGSDWQLVHAELRRLGLAQDTIVFDAAAYAPTHRTRAFWLSWVPALALVPSGDRHNPGPPIALQTCLAAGRRPQRWREYTQQQPEERGASQQTGT